MRVVEATSEYGVYAPNGAFYVSGASYSILMAGSETDVLTMASIDDTMTIRSTSDPTDDYQGTPGSKLTTTRASTASYWDVNGVLQYAATGTLRRDYDPRLSSTTERCGYLIEEARTNICLRSQEFDHATWTKTNTTVTADQTAAPDGTTTADLLTESGNGASITQTLTIASNGTVTVSGFFKRGDTDWTRLMLFETATSANRISVWVNLATGALGTVANGGTGSGATATIQAVANGFYRVALTGAINNSATAVTLHNQSATADNNVNSLASTRYAWGFQVEAGAFASSYIPTAGSTVTRAADLVTLAGTLFPLNQTEGTLYAKFASMGGAASQYPLTLDNGTTAETNFLFRNTSSAVGFGVTDGAAAQASFTSTATLAALTQGKAAGAYKLNDSAAALIGETVVSDIVCTMPTTTTLAFGNRSSDSARALNGWLFEAAYFPTRKDDATLAVLAAAA